MADFFSVSVDALLGYEMKDNRLKATLARLNDAVNTEDPEGLEEAEKALARFPHSFDAVYLSAILFMIFGGKNHDDGLLDRASGLLEEALLLLPQEDGRPVSEISIYQHMANVLIMRGRGTEAAELLKKHNREGIYSSQIGMTLSIACGEPAEARPYLSQALLDNLSRMAQTILGKAYAYAAGGDQESAEGLLRWGIGMLNGLKQPEMTGYLDQTCSYLNLLLAFVNLKKGCSAQAREAMGQALELAERFDSQPSYDARSVRFVDGADRFFLHYILGRTVRESLAFLAGLIGDDDLTALWKGMTTHE